MALKLRVTDCQVSGCPRTSHVDVDRCFCCAAFQGFDGESIACGATRTYQSRSAPGWSREVDRALASLGILTIVR